MALTECRLRAPGRALGDTESMKRGSKRNRQLDLWAGTPALNVLACLRSGKRLIPADPRRIAVMCSPALGDTLLFSGALEDLRAALPEAHITHVCMPQNVAAAEIVPGADERMLVDLSTTGGNGSGASAPCSRMCFWISRAGSGLRPVTPFSRVHEFLGCRNRQRQDRRPRDIVLFRLGPTGHGTGNFRALLLESGLPVAWGRAKPARNRRSARRSGCLLPASGTWLRSISGQQDSARI